MVSFLEKLYYKDANMCVCILQDSVAAKMQCCSYKCLGRTRRLCLLAALLEASSKRSVRNLSRAFAMRNGVETETFPTSSSTCIIFFMRATGNFVRYFFRLISARGRRMKR